MGGKRKYSPRKTYKPFKPQQQQQPQPQLTPEELEAERIRFEQEQLAQFGARTRMRRDSSFRENINRPENQDSINRDRENLMSLAKAGLPLDPRPRTPEASKSPQPNPIQPHPLDSDVNLVSVDERIQEESVSNKPQEKETKKKKEESLININDSTSDEPERSFHEDVDDDWLRQADDYHGSWADDDPLDLVNNDSQTEENPTGLPSNTEQTNDQENNTGLPSSNDQPTVEKKFIIQTMKGPVDLEELDQITHQNHMISLKSQYTRLRNLFTSKLSFTNAPVKDCYNFIKRCEALIIKSETFALFKQEYKVTTRFTFEPEYIQSECERMRQDVTDEVLQRQIEEVQ